MATVDINVLFKDFMKDEKFRKDYFESLNEICNELGITDIKELNEYKKLQESYIPDKPIEDEYSYYWELETRKAKDIYSLRDQFAKKFPEQWEIWGETFDWMIENGKEDLWDRDAEFSLHIEFNDDIYRWGYMYIKESKKRFAD